MTTWYCDSVKLLHRFATSLAVVLAFLAGPAPAENVPTTVIVGMDEAGRPIHPPQDEPANSWTAERPWNGKAARFNEATRRLAFDSFDADRLAGSKPRSVLDHGDTSRKSVNLAAPLAFHAATAAGDPGARRKSKMIYVTKPDGSGGLCLGCKTLVDWRGWRRDRVGALGQRHCAIPARERRENVRYPE